MRRVGGAGSTPGAAVAVLFDKTERSRPFRTGFDFPATSRHPPVRNSGPRRVVDGEVQCGSPVGTVYQPRGAMAYTTLPRRGWVENKVIGGKMPYIAGYDIAIDIRGQTCPSNSRASLQGPPVE